jgi:uncharacterized protein
MLLALIPALLLVGCDAAPTHGSAAASPYPALTGRVVDTAHLLSPSASAALERELADSEAKTKHQMVVVTVSSLGGRSIEDFGHGLGNSWGIGRKGIDDGVMLIVAPNERKVRIEVGYGLEGVLRDEEAGHIIQNDILPRFRAGDLPGGIAAGTRAVLHEIDVPGATP